LRSRPCRFATLAVTAFAINSFQLTSTCPCWAHERGRPRPPPSALRADLGFRSSHSAFGVQHWSFGVQRRRRDRRRGASVCLPADEQTLVPPILRSKANRKKSDQSCPSLRIKLESARHVVAGEDARAPDSLLPFSPETHCPRTTPLSSTDYQKRDRTSSVVKVSGSSFMPVFCRTYQTGQTCPTKKQNNAFTLQSTAWSQQSISIPIPISILDETLKPETKER
jgi:hypothetical protein